MKISDILVMKLKHKEYFTISEMAKILNIPYMTTKHRLRRAGFNAVISEALFEPAALEAIRNVQGKGRPKKAKE